MLATPACFERRCVHYIGVSQNVFSNYISHGTEEPERHVCLAFPEGIPDQIAYGDNLHLTPLPNQGNSIVYEERA